MTQAAGTSRGRSRQEMAAHWFVRRDAGDLSPAEQAQFEAWMADADNRGAFGRAQRGWAVFDDAGGDQHLQALRRAALSARREPRWRAIAAGVAVVAASLVMGVSIHLGRQRGADPATVQGGAVDIAYLSAAALATAPGERRDVQLPDGTRVTLNTDTALDIAYSPGERLVVLRKGQAFFQVAHHPDRPFVVQTSHRRVTALGTAFDVELTAGLFQVVLVEGRVKVDQGAARAGEEASSPEVVLAPGQALVARLGVEERVVELDVERELRWRSGFVEFDNEPLAEAVAELNRYYAAPILVHDPRVAKLRLSGIFRTTPRQEFLSIVSEVLPVRVAARSGEAVELAWAERDP